MAPGKLTRPAADAPRVDEELRTTPVLVVEIAQDAGALKTLRSARQQFERDYITLVLRHHCGRVGDAARALGIQRTNLYRKARQLGISVARPVQQ